jgi:hypothetical protein
MGKPHGHIIHLFATSPLSNINPGPIDMHIIIWSGVKCDCLISLLMWSSGPLVKPIHMPPWYSSCLALLLLLSLFLYCMMVQRTFFKSMWSPKQFSCLESILLRIFPGLVYSPPFINQRYEWGEQNTYFFGTHYNPHERFPLSQNGLIPIAFAFQDSGKSSTAIEWNKLKLWNSKMFL